MIVGVVRDAVFEWDNDGPVRSFAFFPASPTGKRQVALLVRVRGDPEAGRRAIEAALGEAAPGGLGALVAVEQILRLRLYPFQALLALTGFLGGLALLLTISGIYGVLSYLVSQRRREIGIRMALGADARAVTRSLLLQTLRLAGIGAALGALLALGVARLIAHNVQPFDVFDFRGYIGGVAVVMAAAVAASWVPVRRAVRINPAESLRCE
jgi:predicted lysophospholipase L1 biosynthesis ABC-type transport system permease subunit